MVRKIKAKLVLRLREEGFSGRQIAAQGMSRHSVTAVIEAADREGVGWDDVAELDEAAVYRRLFPGRGEHESVHAQPAWPSVRRPRSTPTRSTRARSSEPSPGPVRRRAPTPRSGWS